MDSLPSRLNLPFEAGANFERPPEIAASPRFERDMIRLCGSLGLDRQTGECQVVQFLGVGAKDGTSSICLGLAYAAAFRIGQRVLLVEADAPSADRDRLIIPTGKDAVSRLVPAEALTGLSPDSSRLLVTSLWKRQEEDPPTTTPFQLYLLMWLRSRFDLIVIDSNRSAFSADGQSIAGMAHGFVLVMSSERPSVELAAEAADRLKQGGGMLRGIVLSRGAA